MSILYFSIDFDAISNSIEELASIGRGLGEIKGILGCQNENSICEKENCLTSTITFMSFALLRMESNFQVWKSGMRENLTCGASTVQRNLDDIITYDLSDNVTFPSSYGALSSGSAGAGVAAFASKMESLVEAVLLSIQKLVKVPKEKLSKDKGDISVQESESKVNSDNVECEADDDKESLKENHLIELTSKLQQYIICLQCPQVHFRSSFIKIFLGFT